MLLLANGSMYRNAAVHVAGAVKEVLVTAPNGTGNSAVTGVGFQPDLMFMFGNGVTSLANTTTGRMFFGAARSSSERAGIAIYARHNIAISETSHNLRTDYLNSVPAGNGSDASSDICDFTSFDSDGFTLNWNVNANGQFYPTLQLKGLSSKIGSFDTNTSTGSQAITGVGFQPKAVIFFGCGIDTTEGGQATGQFNIGAGDGSGQFVMATQSEDNNTTTNTHRYVGNASVYAELGNSAIELEASLTSLDADGFTLNLTTAPGVARRVNYVALGGAYLSVDVGNIASKATTGNQAYTGIGFQPTALILVANDATTGAYNIYGGGGEVNIGFVTGTANRHYFSHTDETASGTSNTGRSGRALAIGTRAQSAITSTVTEADFVTFDVDGFTLNWTAANASTRAIAYIALRID